MKAFVDTQLCIGCGLCASIAPDVFRITAAGTSEAYGEITDDTADSVQQAVDSCPVSAISYLPE